jgi:hypothetical protein
VCALQRGAARWPAFRARLLQHCQDKWEGTETLSYKQLQAAVLAVGGAGHVGAKQKQQQHDVYEQLQQAHAANQPQRVLELQHELDMLEADACIGQELLELNALQQERQRRDAQRLGLENAARQVYDMRQEQQAAQQQSLVSQSIAPHPTVNPLTAPGVSALGSRIADASFGAGPAAAAVAEAAEAAEADAAAGSEGADAAVQQGSAAELLRGTLGPGAGSQQAPAAAAGASSQGLPSAISREQGLLQQQQQQQQQHVQSVEQPEQEQPQQEQVHQQAAADIGGTQVGGMRYLTFLIYGCVRSFSC